METRTPASKPTRQPTPAERRRAEKNARQAAARAAEQAELQKRQARNRWLGLGAIVVLAAVVVGIVALLGGFSGTSKVAAKPSNVPIGAEPSPAWVPDLPKGADAALKVEPKVSAGTGTVSALKVTTLVQGTGAVVQKGDTITVNYVGVTYKDGKEFDSSWSRGATTQFPIGVGQVIPGWDQGLVGVKVGSRVQLDIPTALAYGPDAAANGEPAGDLRFVVDVLATGPTPSAAPTVGATDLPTIAAS